MPNMSYCMFENTRADLEQCIEVLFDKGVEGLSVDEQKEAKRLIKVCKSIVDNCDSDDGK